MKTEYESPSIEIAVADVDVITTSDWELPKDDWDWT